MLTKHVNILYTYYLFKSMRSSSSSLCLKPFTIRGSRFTSDERFIYYNYHFELNCLIPDRFFSLFENNRLLALTDMKQTTSVITYIMQVLTFPCKHKIILGGFNRTLFSETFSVMQLKQLSSRNVGIVCDFCIRTLKSFNEQRKLLLS